MDGRRSGVRIQGGSIRSRSLPNRRQFQADAAFWGNARATLVLITLADAQAFNEILRVLGHARSDAFIRAGAQRLIEILGPGTAIYHVSILSFAFRLPGHAEPDPPAMIERIVEGFREPILCDDVPIDTRIGIGLKALGRRGSPGEDLRAALVGGAGQPRRAHAAGPGSTARRDEAHRRAFRLLSDLKHALERRGPARAALPAEGDARHRAPASAPRRCCAGPIRSSARSRRASSSRWPRRPRSSRR